MVWLTDDAVRVKAWALGRGWRYDPRPHPEWFEAWEPFDTLVAPSRYINAVVGTCPPGHVAIVEPWLAEDDAQPLDRTLLGFVTHPALRYRAAVRRGSWFLTRVAFVGTAPPNQVQLGDGTWDDRMATFAMSEDIARQAFHPQLRSLLLSWRWHGHLELRPGGLVLHVAGLRPIADDVKRLAEWLPDLVANAVAYPGGSTR